MYFPAQFSNLLEQLLYSYLKRPVVAPKPFHRYQIISKSQIAKSLALIHLLLSPAMINNLTDQKECSALI